MSSAPTLTEKELLQCLSEIRDKEFEVPSDVKPFELIKEIGLHLGSTDPVLRDDLGYTLFANWIYTKRLLQPEQLRELYDMMNSDHMWFSNIGEKDTPSVLLRSFTSLVIVLLLLVDQDEPFLSKEEWETLLQDTVNYCSLEKDLRGYVENQGWAHAAAHVSDVLNVFGMHPSFTEKHTDSILAAIHSVMYNASFVFQDEEDERLARALVTLVQNHHLTLTALTAWFQQADIECDTYLESMRRRINWKHLYRSTIDQLQLRGLLLEANDLLNIKNKFHYPGLYQ